MQRFRSDFRREAGRAPYGARGLKLNSVGVDLEHGQSRPVWGAWIEITITGYNVWFTEVAPRMGRVD